MSDPIIYRVRYPFLRCKAAVYDGECGITEIDSWKPGTEYRGQPNEYTDCELFADGVGEMLITEVSRHKPAHYPERVFFTRRFVNPEGVEFGKAKLHCAVASKFNRTVKGYAHAYIVEDAR